MFVEVIQVNDGTWLNVKLDPKKTGCVVLAFSTRKGAKKPMAKDTFIRWDNTHSAKSSDSCVHKVPKMPAYLVSAVYLWTPCPN